MLLIRIIKFGTRRPASLGNYGSAVKQDQCMKLAKYSVIRSENVDILLHCLYI